MIQRCACRKPHKRCPVTPLQSYVPPSEMTLSVSFMHHWLYFLHRPSKDHLIILSVFECAGSSVLVAVPTNNCAVSGKCRQNLHSSTVDYDNSSVSSACKHHITSLFLTNLVMLLGKLHKKTVIPRHGWYSCQGTAHDRSQVEWHSGTSNVFNTVTK